MSAEDRPGDDRPIGLAYTATVAMMTQHTFSSMTKGAIPVVAPAMLPALGLEPAFLGVIMGVISFSGFWTMVGSGCFIRRFGGLRMGQAALLINSVFTTIFAIGVVPIMLLSSFVIGIGVAISTPAGSQVVARHAPPRLAPLMFSIKQTAVPVGIVAAGLLVPVLIGIVGWQGTLLTVAGICLVLSLALQPLRDRLDVDREPNARLTPADMLVTIRGVLGHPGIRELGFAAFAFLGIQATFTAFFVSYLTVGLGYPLATVGPVFSAALAVAVFTRILWGWVAGRTSPRFVLAVIGLSSGLLMGALGFSTANWGLVLITGIGMGISATAIAWHGVLLAEVARLAPPGTAGAMCGGAFALGILGEIAFPLMFGALLATTGSFTVGFLVAALPATLFGLRMLRTSPGASA